MCPLWEKGGLAMALWFGSHGEGFERSPNGVCFPFFQEPDGSVAFAAAADMPAVGERRTGVFGTGDGEWSRGHHGVRSWRDSWEKGRRGKESCRGVGVCNGGNL